MLAQEIFTVVVAIGGANDDMDVVPVGLLVLRERLTPLVVKLNDHDGAMDPIVKDAIFFHATHPGKVGLAKMPLDLFHLYFSVAGADAADMNLN